VLIALKGLFCQPIGNPPRPTADDRNVAELVPGETQQSFAICPDE
jgi:hypothetical protein